MLKPDHARKERTSLPERVNTNPDAGAYEPTRYQRGSSNDITFESVFTYPNLYKSYRKCRRQVGWKHSTQAYKANACINIRKTQKELLSGKWKSKGFIEFDIMERGKKRHIKSVHISERVVQRCLCDYCLTPLLGRSLIPDNSASQKDKGMDCALRRLTRQLQQHYRKYGTEGYILQFDFHKFFESVDHEAVFRLLDRKVKDKRLRDLTKYLVKMFGVRGLGLGSQVSQNIAVSIPDRLDHIIKERFHIRGYGRYMDDGYAISHDKETLRKVLDAIRKESALFGVEINEKKTQIVKLSHGFTFLKIKFSITETGRIVKRLSRTNVTRERRKLKKLAKMVPPDDLKASFTSWKGHASRCRSHRTQQAMKEVYDKCMQISTDRNTPSTASSQKTE